MENVTRTIVCQTNVTITYLVKIVQETCVVVGWWVVVLLLLLLLLLIVFHRLDQFPKVSVVVLHGFKRENALNK